MEIQYHKFIFFVECFIDIKQLRSLNGRGVRKSHAKIYTFETYVYLFFLIFMRNHKKRELEGEKVEHKIVDGNNQGMAAVELNP